jgi:hypothetical protein
MGVDGGQMRTDEDGYGMLGNVGGGVLSVGKDGCANGLGGSLTD